MQTKEKTTNKLDSVFLNDPNLIWKNTNKTLQTNPTPSKSPLKCSLLPFTVLKNSKKLTVLNNNTVMAIDTTKMT